MLTVGLTGGIASGKSTVSRLLRERGAPIVDADQIVHQLQAPGSPLVTEIAQAFGPEIIRPDGSLDRPRLGAIVFADPAKRHQLEAIVHPPVRAQIWAEVERHRQGGSPPPGGNLLRGQNGGLLGGSPPAVILDIPLLVEGGWQERLDQVWLVWVDATTQVERLMARDGLAREGALARIGAQMPLDQKRAVADLVIDNTGTLHETEAQVDHAWRALLASAR
ncbi:MAG TPA: dephospho-CoA kinase [Symbiobacteriaceae bacterium]|nr:dephospho-CoA kinase [Symbiobacteriaceae bacterium]